MSQEPVEDSVRFTTACPACGSAAAATGGQSLVLGRLEWSVETACPACGPTAVCGHGETPAELRERLLDGGEHSPAQLYLTGEGHDRAVPALRVLRAQLGMDLGTAKAALRDIRSGRYTGTLPEIAHLVAALRTAGVGARAVRRGR